MEKNPWITLQSKAIYNNKWITVTEDDVINPKGGKGIYGKVHFKNIAIGIVAMDEEQCLWLVGQYRYTLNAYSWEIPEGGSPHAENSLDGAKRELKEETGLNPLDNHVKKFSVKGLYKYKKKPKEYSGIVGQSYKLFAIEVSFPKNGIVKIDKHEHSGWKWLTIDKAILRVTWQNQKECLRVVDEWVKKISLKY